jgi:translocator protein
MLWELVHPMVLLLRLRNMNKLAIKIIFVLGWIMVCEFVGILGSFFTFSQIPNWYQHLNKPFFSPPNFVFAPVWTTLYALMGISIALVLGSKILKKDKNYLVAIFSLQLVLNFLWSIIFFGMHQPLVAFIEIIFLWATILLLIIRFYKFSKIASYLLVPYLLWVSFASLLNLAVAILN